MYLKIHNVVMKYASPRRQLEWLEQSVAGDVRLILSMLQEQQGRFLQVPSSVSQTHQQRSPSPSVQPVQDTREVRHIFIPLVISIKNAPQISAFSAQ